MTFGGIAFLVAIAALYIGFERGLIAALKGLFRWLSVKIERRDRIALGLPVGKEPDGR